MTATQTPPLVRAYASMSDLQHWQTDAFKLSQKSSAVVMENAPPVVGVNGLQEASETEPGCAIIIDKSYNKQAQNAEPLAFADQLSSHAGRRSMRRVKMLSMPGGGRGAAVATATAWHRICVQQHAQQNQPGEQERDYFFGDATAAATKNIKNITAGKHDVDDMAKAARPIIRTKKEATAPAPPFSSPLICIAREALDITSTTSMPDLQQQLLRGPTGGTVVALPPRNNPSLRGCGVVPLLLDANVVDSSCLFEKAGSRNLCLTTRKSQTTLPPSQALLSPGRDQGQDFFSAALPSDHRPAQNAASHQDRPVDAKKNQQVSKAPSIPAGSGDVRSPAHESEDRRRVALAPPSGGALPSRRSVVAPSICLAGGVGGAFFLPADEPTIRQGAPEDAIAAAALHRAILDSDWPSVLHLVESHPHAVSRPVTFRFRGERSSATLLHEAVCASSSYDVPPSVLDALIEAYPHAVLTGDGSAGRLPIHVAIMEGAPPGILRQLLQCCPECATKKDKGGNAMLHHAAVFGTDEAIRIALEYSSSQHSSCAVQEGAGREVISASSSSATAAAAPNKRGRTPLHLLIARCSSLEGCGGSDDSHGTISPSGLIEAHPIRLSTVKSLLEAYPEAIAHRDNRGRLPLHEACNSYNPRWDLVGLLLATGGPLAAATKDDKGRTPLDLLRAVNPGLVKSASKARRGKHSGLHPTLAELVRATKSAEKTRRRSLLPSKAADLLTIAPTAARVTRRAVVSSLVGRNKNRLRRSLFHRRSEDVVPSDHQPPASAKDDVGTYIWYESPVTTVGKKKTYTLPY